MGELTVNGALEQRRRLAAGLGLQFDGARDVFAAAGYDGDIAFERYRARYERQDIAARVVDAPAAETWRRAPVIVDGVTEGDGRDDTEFAQAWAEFASIEEVGDELEDRRTVWHYLRRVDELAGIGRYGVLLVGINDGLPLGEPLAPGRVAGPDGYLYLSAFDEGDAQLMELENAPASRRYGLPLRYRLGLGTNLQGDAMQPLPVHWSRVVHVAEGLKGDEIFGTPRLRPVWNRLLDLEKIMAGAGEAAWKLLYKGLILSTRDGYRLDTTDGETEEKVEEYIHGLRRFLQLEGMDVTVAGGEVVDPTGLVNLNVALIAAATNIPQRLLLGSERGELASSQDEQAWARYVAGRQRNFAEPMILRPLINRLVYAGVLPKPASGRYVVVWPEVREADAATDAAVAQAYAQALASVLPGSGQAIDVREFVAALVRPLDNRTAVVAAVTPEPALLPAGVGGDEPDGDAPDDAPDDEPGEEGEEGMATNVAPFWGGVEHGRWDGARWYP
jgi:hypothetical protein